MVIATGVAARLPNVAGQDLEGVFCLRDLSDAVAIKRFIQEGRVKRASIIGAGFIALEMCEAFKSVGLETKIIHRGELPMQNLGEDFGRKILTVIKDNGVEFLPDRKIEAFEGGRENGLLIHTNEERLDTDLILIGIGVLPQVTLASEAGVSMGPTGAIAVNDHMQTNFPFVYSAGDCCETYHRISRKPVHVPLGDVANKQGYVAGANIGGQDLSFPGVLGSFCCKIFDWELAATGLGESVARELGLDVHSVTIEAGNKPEGFSGAHPLWLRLVADKRAGRLIGAQAIGGEGAVSRVNLLAAALTGGLTLGEIANLDLAYAPPFSSARDPVHIAAQQLLK